MEVKHLRFALSMERDRRLLELQLQVACKRSLIDIDESNWADLSA